MNAMLSGPPAADTRAFALALALSGTCLCAVVLGMARLLQRRSEPLVYGILLGGVVGLLVLPALLGAGQSLRDALVGFLPPPAEEIVKIPAEQLPQILQRPPRDGPVFDEEHSSQGELAGTVLVALWALGFTLALGRLAHAFWRQRHILVGQPWPAELGTSARQARLARTLGLHKFPTVHLSPVAPMPMVLGVLRPRIVLPAAAPEVWGAAQLEAILLHEAAHIARRDPLALLAQRLAVNLFWWCPLVYCVSRRLSQLRENICDDYALTGPCDPIAYAEILVQSAERLLHAKTCAVPLALLTSAQSGLEARLKRLLEKEVRPMTQLSLPGKLFGAIFLAAACVFTTAATALSGGQAPPDKKVRIKIIVDGKEFDLGDIQAGHRSDAGPKKEGVAIAVDNIAIKEAPDGGAIQIGDGSKVLRWVVGTPDGSKRIHFVQAAASQAPADPRIEELVKRAEAIKPGSGAQVRAALQGAGQPGEQGKVLHYRVTSPGTVYWSAKTDKPSGPVRLWQATDGKKIIVLSIEDGNVVQLKDKDIKKILDKSIHLQVREAPKNPTTGATKKPTKTTGGLQVHHEFQGEEGEHASNSPKGAKFAPSRASEQSRANEMEALRRQLERISAELQTLKKRLDTSKR